MTPDEVEQLAQVLIVPRQQDQGGSVCQDGDQDRSAVEFQDGGPERSQVARRAELLGVPDQGGGEGGEGVSIGGGRQGLLDDKTLTADDGDTGHFGPGGEAVDEAPEHGRS